MTTRLLPCVFLLLVLDAAPQTKRQTVTEYPSPLVREEQIVVVDGAIETWRLKWKSRPKPSCAPEETSLSCPCAGFAYGEEGDLELIRVRNWAEIDRFDITSLFSGDTGVSEKAVVQRWKPEIEKDFDASQRPGFPLQVSQRPTVQVMQFGDYDHDGWSTEFYLQTDVEPCGKSSGIVIGVSKANRRLHALTSTGRPAMPLGMMKFEWEAIRNAAAPVDLIDLRCGDHASDQEITLHLSWTSSGISGTRRSYTCSSDDKRGALLGEEPL